ncbi:MAG TPA: DUF357 domain-containing protein [Thermoplasmata archaeon]|nr:DUF357 domain-containing protein [Thermoplasmata archaeon]
MTPDPAERASPVPGGPTSPRDGALDDRYIALTRDAIARVRSTPPARSFLVGASEDFLGMARAYLSDAQHFLERGDAERALAAASYAHGWLDAGVRLGILDGGDDDVRFTPFR